MSSPRYIVVVFVVFCNNYTTTSIIIEGHNQYPDRAEEIIEDGLEKATSLAVGF